VPCGPGTERETHALMFDLAAIAIAVACFVFLFVMLWAMERV
jgi:uncharacterized membrane protein YqiK